MPWLKNAKSYRFSLTYSRNFGASGVTVGAEYRTISPLLFGLYLLPQAALGAVLRYFIEPLLMSL